MDAPGSTTTAPSSTAPGSTTSSQLNDADKRFMMKAAQGDMTEIQTSQLALQRSSNRAVRTYAQQMIREHTNSSRQLMQLAKQKGVTLPKDIGNENKALLAKLQKTSSREFDQAYMNGQLAAHARTQAEYQREIQQGQDQAVKAFANRVLPIVAGHLRMAQSMVANR